MALFVRNLLMFLTIGVISLINVGCGQEEAELESTQEDPVSSEQEQDDLGKETEISDYDIIIKNGTLIDGTGLEKYEADVGIVGDRITTIGDLSASQADKELHAEGLYVTPGFINIHSHAT